MKNIGLLGEDIAIKFLLRKGFSLERRNYRTRFGEIDIIGRDDRGGLVFAEVKSVEASEDEWEAVSRDRRPEGRVDEGKLKKIRRAVGIYLSHHAPDQAWCFIVLGVYIDGDTKKAKVVLVEDVL